MGFVQRWYASMKRSGITLRTRQVATTTAATAILVYLWDWAVYGWLLAGHPLARQPSPVAEAVAALLVALVFALLFAMRSRPGSVPGGLACGFLAGVLTNVPAHLLGGPGSAEALAVRALPGVVVLSVAGVLAALIHRRGD
jgi:hypothetical protein